MKAMFGCAALILMSLHGTVALAASAADDAANTVHVFHAALKRGDSATALAQLSADALIYESGFSETRNAYVSHHLDADMAFAKDVRRIVKSSQVQCSDTLCVVMQESETTGSYKSKAVKSIGVETTVLQRDGDTWKIRHVHWSSRN